MNKNSKKYLEPSRDGGNQTEMRQLSLLFALLKSQAGLGFTDIRSRFKEFYNNENLESDRKKLHRDISDLKNLGFPVLYDSLVDAYKMQSNTPEIKIRFSREELNFLAGLFFLVKKDKRNPGLSSALRKLFSGNPDFFQELAETEDGILLDKMETDNPTDETLPVDSIMNCIKNRIPISLRYNKRPGIIEIRNLDPLELIRRNSVETYIFGYDRDKKNFRKFLIGKIRSIKELSGGFNFRGGETPVQEKNYHPLHFGIHPWPVQCEITVHKEYSDLFSTYLFPHPHKKEGDVFRFESRNPGALARFIFRYPEAFANISPQEALDEILQKAKTIEMNYRD